MDQKHNGRKHEHHVEVDGDHYEEPTHKHNKQNGHDHSSLDHSDHHAMMIKDFRKRFWISLAFTIPILVLSPMIHGLLGYIFYFTGS